MFILNFLKKLNHNKNVVLDKIIYFLRLFWLLVRKFFRHLHRRVFIDTVSTKKKSNASQFYGYFNFYSRWKGWINSSTLNYAVFFFGSSAVFALVRYLQIWFTGSWDLLPFYYFVVAISFFFSFCAIFGRYQSNVSPRVQRNRIKSQQYFESVIRENGMQRSRFFAHVYWNFPIFFPMFALEYINDFYYDNQNKNLTLAGLVIVIFFAIPYTLNRIWYTYNMYRYYVKPQTPDKYMPEASELTIKLIDSFVFKPIDKVHALFSRSPPVGKTYLRKYASKTKWQRIEAFLEKNKKSIAWGGAIFLTSINLASSVSNLDVRQSEFRDTTSIVSRSGSVSETGYWSDNTKIARRARVLSRWGVELDEFAYDGSRKLDPAKVNEAYENEHIARYPRSRFGAQRRVDYLESELAGTKSELADTKERLEKLERLLSTKESSIN